MSPATSRLNPSEAARQLGVSAKALRLYEQRGMVVPARSEAGWRTYGPDDMKRAADIVALRSVGLSLAQVARVLAGDADDLAPVLTAHQQALEGRMRQIADMREKVRAMSGAQGRTPLAEVRVAFELPWPWGGEMFELRDIRAINYIVGPLFSGKTRLAERLAATLPGAVFVGLERLNDGAAKARRGTDAALGARVAKRLAGLANDGATISDALTALIVDLEAEGPAALVIDMIEQKLDEASQEALAAHLRRHGSRARPVFCLTRSSAILDLPAVGPDETIIFCPANHSPPFLVAPCPGTVGYDAVATCLGSPQTRARTEGVAAHWPQAA